jgi:hypothetical protein
MAYEFRRVIRVFIASPGDVEEEREKLDEVFAELNRGQARDRGLYLEPIKYETNTYPSIGRVQQRVFEQIGEFDLLIGLMWARFGTPTGNAGSGTEEELHEALDRHKRGTLKDVMWYFRMDAIPPDSDSKQLGRVQEFRKDYSSIGGYREYRGVQDFVNKVREHLSQWIHEQPLLSCSELGPHTYILDDQNQDGPIQCFIDFRAQRSSLLIEPIADESDLFYLLVERVVSCEQTRDTIKQALRSAASEESFSQASFQLTGLYDTMGKWDVLARFRAPGLTEPRGLFRYLRQQILRQSPSAALRLVNVEREAPSLTYILSGSWQGKLQHRWLGDTKTYWDQQCQRFFLYVELPATDSEQKLLIQSLNQVIGQHRVARIIESVSYAAQDNALVLEIFTTCSQAMLVHELNRLVESCIPSFKTGKSTLCCFESEELHRNMEAVIDA